MSKTFLIGSCEPFSGKSALVLGIARNLIASNHLVRFGKPLATSLELNVSGKGDIENMIDDNYLLFILFMYRRNIDYSD